MQHTEHKVVEGAPWYIQIIILALVFVSGSFMSAYYIV